MTLGPRSPQLMTAAEREGFRIAVDYFRHEAGRMRRAANLIGEAPAGDAPVAALEQRQKNQILELCAKAVDLCADRAESLLPRRLN